MNEISEMDRMYEEAWVEGLWFFCIYDQFWFSPDELAAEQAKGNFLWLPSNWKLRDPKERLAELDREMVEAEQRRDEFVIRMEKSKP